MSYVSRLVRTAEFSNLLNVRLVEVFFQKSPGRGEGRGIGGLEFHVVSGGTVVQTGSTGDDGKVDVPVSGAVPSELQIMNSGNPVASYTIRIRDDAWEANNTVLGVQRRLRAVGYQLGHVGTGNDGIDGTVGSKTDRAIQDFQIDQGVAFDGLVSDNTRTKLDQEVGGSV